jgi:hypothetical protein
MKLGKEEIQKIFLGGLMLIGLLYCYFAMLLGPLASGKALNEKKTEEIRGKITAAKKELKQAQDVEAAAPQHALLLKQINALIPEGSPVAWFPVRVTELFKQYGLDRTSTRVTQEAPEKELLGYKRLTWGVEITKAEFLPMAEAVASFENSEMLAEISAVQIETTLESLGTQRVLLTVNNIVKQ